MTFNYCTMKTFNDVDILPDKNLQRKYCKIYRWRIKMRKGKLRLDNTCLNSSLREEGEGHHISLSHSVANTDPKR